MKSGTIAKVAGTLDLGEESGNVFADLVLQIQGNALQRLLLPLA